MNHPMAQETTSSSALLNVEAVTKRYLGVTALDGVELTVQPAQIHALIGGNGAGKSTLINVLSGVTIPDAGTITLAGEQLDIKRPSDALQLGITTIHQELSVVPALTTLDNVFLGREMRSRVLGLNVRLNRRKMTDRVVGLAEEFGLTREDLTLPVGEFGALKKRVVEIVKALAFDTQLLILDEPTSGLEEEERLHLFDHMRKLRNRGVALVWVTHHLEELVGLADAATVFRDGRHVGTVAMAETSVDELVELMFGVAAGDFGAPSTVPAEPEAGPAGEVLRLVNFSRGNVLKNISLEVRKGEILGIAGLAGAGRTELARAIMGVDKVTTGSMTLHGRAVQARSSSSMYRRGLAMVPEDRKQLGILADLSVAENISISSLPDVSRFGFVIKRRAELAQAENYRRSLSIRTSSVKQKVRDLSGGNQQKAIVARCLSTNPDLLIFDEPTQGIDVSAKVEVHNLIREFVAKGGAAIVIASETAELIDLSHRVLVMKKGRIVGQVDAVPHALAEGRFDSVQHEVLSLSAGKAQS